MIPMLVSVPDVRFKVLPVGIHDSSLQEVEQVYSTNHTRSRLFEGLVEGAKALSIAGCKTLYLNGSYVTSKRHPNDYDACWDPQGVNLIALDPAFVDTNLGTAYQKEKYYGEFYPSSIFELSSNLLFIDFFQSIANTEHKKGIIRIDIKHDPILRSFHR